MANSYKGNPIILDTFTGDLNLSYLANKLTDGPMFIKRVVFTGPTANDVVVLKDGSGNIVAKLRAYATNQDVALEYSAPYQCTGLQLLAADNTVTTGEVLVYV